MPGRPPTVMATSSSTAMTCTDSLILVAALQTTFDNHGPKVITESGGLGP
jgi:hypothetical protein